MRFLNVALAVSIKKKS